APRPRHPDRGAAGGAGGPWPAEAARAWHHTHPSGPRSRRRAGRARSIPGRLMQRDARGFRVAVVDDDFAGSASDRFDVVGVLQRAEWGAILLPPSWYPDEVAADLLEQFAEHIEEFVRHGYEVVCIGACE